MSLLQSILILIVVLLINWISSSTIDIELTTNDFELTTQSVYEKAIIEIRTMQNDLKKEKKQLKIYRERLEEEKKISKSIKNIDILQFNVGSEIMFTTRETLMKIPKSTLFFMFNGRWEHKLQRDKSGIIFLDFNPFLFRHLLDQLQTIETNDNSFHLSSPSQPSLTEPFNKMLNKLGLQHLLLTEKKNVITFNVGGQIITNQRRTFTPVSNSTFDTIIASSKVININNESDVFLDYNPKIFQHLIKQLREESFEKISHSELSSNQERISFQAMLIDLNIYQLGENGNDTQSNEVVLIYYPHVEGDNQTEQISSSISTNVVYTTWQQNGITIAGGNGQGDELNQLSNPSGIYVDDDNQCIYVTDRNNHRIVEWKYGEKIGRVIAGGNDQGDQINQLNNPVDVIIDKQNDYFIICDYENKRVMRWPRHTETNGEIFITNISCKGLAMDNDLNLYTSDWLLDEVRQWEIGETEGTLVAGGHGGGAGINQLYYADYIFVDEERSVYVSDSQNHRVMKWLKDAKEGIIVAGGHGEGNNFTQLSYPTGVVVDQLSNVYVADSKNHRIMRWSKEAEEGVIAIGGNGEGEESNQFNLPMDLSFDRQGNLYVVDANNHRIQKFEIDSEL